jgi:hypothetical protein
MNHLKEHLIDVLIFSRHATHEMQPFDVYVPWLLQPRLEQLLLFIFQNVKKTSRIVACDTEESLTRTQLFEFFLEVWTFASTLSNTASGFECSAVISFNPDQPLTNLLRPKHQQTQLHRFRRQKGSLSSRQHPAPEHMNDFEARPGKHLAAPSTRLRTRLLNRIDFSLGSSRNHILTVICSTPVSFSY